MMKQVAFALMIGAQLVAATGENPICFVCGSKYATITNHTAVVQISPEFNLNVTEITCELLSMAGQRKYIPVNACAAAKKSKELKTVCGCTELKKTSMSPIASPTKHPSGFQSDVPSIVPSDVPSDGLSDFPSLVPSLIPSVVPNGIPTLNQANATGNFGSIQGTASTAPKYSAAWAVVLLLVTFIH